MSKDETREKVGRGCKGSRGRESGWGREAEEREGRSRKITLTEIWDKLANWNGRNHRKEHSPVRTENSNRKLGGGKEGGGELES